MAVAIVTGASKGLGRALSLSLARRGWSLVIDARGKADLKKVRAELELLVGPGAAVTVTAGDVADEDHREELLEAARRLGGLDLLVNNASTLGPTPLLRLSRFSLEDLRHVYEVNSFAPLALVQRALELLARSEDARVLNISSDASVEAYETWGGYGSSKAALDHLGAVLAAEEPTLRVWSVDPGDMRTEMHQSAFPGEDISDRPLPETVAPILVGLIESPLPSGRYKANELALRVGVLAGSSETEVPGR